MFQLKATRLQLHAESESPGGISTSDSTSRAVAWLMSRAVCRAASSELVQQGMAEALQACAAMLQQHQQLAQEEEQGDGGDDADEEGTEAAALHAGLAQAELLLLLGLGGRHYDYQPRLLLLGIGGRHYDYRPQYDMPPGPSSGGHGMQRLWGLLGAGGDGSTAMDDAAARVLALLLDMGHVTAPAAEPLSAQALGALAWMLSDAVVAGEAAAAGCSGHAGPLAGPAAGSAASVTVTVTAVVTCLCATVAGHPQLQVLLLGLSDVVMAISTMLAVPHMVQDGLRLLRTVASSRATAQRPAVSHPALLQALLALLQQVHGDDVPALLEAQAQQVLALLHTLVTGQQQRPADRGGRAWHVCSPGAAAWLWRGRGGQ
jgi:hypothetical protein